MLFEDALNRHLTTAPSFIFGLLLSWLAYKVGMWFLAMRKEEIHYLYANMQGVVGVAFLLIAIGVAIDALRTMFREHEAHILQAVTIYLIAGLIIVSLWRLGRMMLRRR